MIDGISSRFHLDGIEYGRPDDVTAGAVPRSQAQPVDDESEKSNKSNPAPIEDVVTLSGAVRELPQDGNRGDAPKTIFDQNGAIAEAREPQGAQEAEARPTAVAESNANTRDEQDDNTIAASGNEKQKSDSDVDDIGPKKENELDEEEQRVVAELKQRDRHVKMHEAAHLAAGGQYVQGGASYDYQTGPDGKRYAVGGEVGISTSPEGTPEETIEKARAIQRAAHAPSDPSPQDRKVAANAAAMATEASQNLAAESQEEPQNTSNDGPVPAPSRERRTTDANGSEVKPEVEPNRTPIAPQLRGVIPAGTPIDPKTGSAARKEPEVTDNPLLAPAFGRDAGTGAANVAAVQGSPVVAQEAMPQAVGTRAQSPGIPARDYNVIKAHAAQASAIPTYERLAVQSAVENQRIPPQNEQLASTTRLSPLDIQL